MASAINYNTVWTSIFEPVPTFAFLRALRPARRRCPSGTTCPTTWSAPTWPASCCAPGPACTPGSRATRWWRTACRVELESPDGHNDTMLDPEQRIWGFETNFGGLAELALVKSNQLMPKPAHLTWEEAASPGLVNSTAYRQLVSRNGAGMKQGDIVLIWGASGGLGSYATQFALNGGATPVCVVSSAEKAGIARSMGAELIIDRSARGLPVLEGRARPRTRRSGSGSASRSASSPAATTSTSSSSTRAARPSAPACSWRARAARSSPARPPPASCTSTTTATSG